MRVLAVDNYDSFTYNLVQYLGELGCELEVVRNDRASVDDLLAGGYDRVIVSPGPCTPNEAGISLEAVRNDAARVDDLLQGGWDRVVVSPGPCTPNEAGISVEAMRRFPEAGVATLGVCLGHQSLAQAFGGKVVRHVPIHGKTTEVEHDGTGLFEGLPNPLTVGRYHSLVVDPDLPGELEPTAWGGGVLMAMRHRELPAQGVQFHPESVLTPDGKRLLETFLA